MNRDGQRRPEEILAEIEQTRSNIDATLSAIQHRLTPGQLMEQGADYLRHSGAEEFVSNLGSQVKYNPLPVSLVGIGLAWLMAASKTPGNSSEFSSQVGESKEQAKQRIAQLGERVNELGQSARNRMSQAREGYSHLVQEQPLALGAVGVAIGALLAAYLPRTRQEDEMLGEASDKFSEAAQAAGKDVASSVAGSVAPPPPMH
jgi:ElaB/YqjD/DUF883 family membrane-anchored ribosome-binding protein